MCATSSVKPILLLAIAVYGMQLPDELDHALERCLSKWKKMSTDPGSEPTKTCARHCAPFRIEECASVPVSFDDRGQKHLQTCSTMNCSERTHWRSHKRWRNRCPIDPNNASRGSWIVPILHTHLKTKEQWFGLQCSACNNNTSVQTAFGTGTVGCPQLGDEDDGDRERPLMVETLVRHQKRHNHLQALTLVGVDVETALPAPSSEQFQTVLSVTRAGEAKSTHGIKHVGKRKKIRKMKWCLCEAHRRSDLKFLEQSETIAIAQDVRHSKLLIRFKATKFNFKSRRGVSGVATVPNASAQKLKDSTIDILAAACTTNKSVPWKRKVIKHQFHKKKFHKVRTRIEEFASDCAADEQLCGQLLREMPADPQAMPGSTRMVYKVVCPKMKLVRRDKSHAAGRVTKRPWRAHPVLRRVHHKYIWGKRSLTSIVHNSHTFRHRFAKSVQRNQKVNLELKICLWRTSGSTHLQDLAGVSVFICTE